MASWLNRFLGRLDSDLSLPLRIRLFRLVCLTTAGLCLLLVLPMNSFQNLPAWVNLGSLLLGLFSFGCYWASRKGHDWSLPFFIVLVLILNSFWNLNAGSEGSITYYFFPALLYPLAILRGRTRWVLSALLLLNVCGLLVMEYFHPGLTVPFPSRSDKLIDLLTGAIASFAALAAVFWLILKTYDREQARVSGFARELATSEKNYREIFNASSDAMIIRDETGRLLDVNERMCTMFGYSREEAMRLSIDDMSLGVSPYTAAEVKEKFERALREGSQTYRWRNRRRNGELFWSEVVVHASEIAGQKRLVVVLRDISSRVRAEEALRDNEERLRLALAASRQGWFEMNVQTGVGLASEEYIRIIGHDPDGFVTTQQNWLDNVHPADRETVSQEYRSCIATGESRTMDYRRRTKAGEWKWIRSVGKIVDHDADGKPLRMLGTHMDITEQKELETRLLHSQRLESIGTLAAGIAHDLNNVLTPMLMVSSALEDKLPDPADRELMGILEAQAKRGAAIVRQLLAFSRNMAQSRVSVDLVLLIREMMEMMRETFPQNIKLALQVPEKLWTVTADPIQLHQVILNLCVNARDAMPEGGTLTVGAQNTESPEGEPFEHPNAVHGQMVAITVTDTGHGIPPEIRSRIFDPFFTTKGVGKGTGLGLSTVYGIVKAHGGAVTFDSEPNRGTRFKVFLPAKPFMVPVGDASPAEPGACRKEPGSPAYPKEPALPSSVQTNQTTSFSIR
jgi:PAS domain S-box-containing protein